MADEVTSEPRHPYTKALLGAVPSADRNRAIRLAGEPASPLDPPTRLRVPPPLQCRGRRVRDRRRQPRAGSARRPAGRVPGRRDGRPDADRPHPQPRPGAHGLMAVAEPAIGWQRNAPPRIRRRLTRHRGRPGVERDRVAILGLVAVTVVCIAAPWIAPHSPTDSRRAARSSRRTTAASCSAPTRSAATCSAACSTACGRAGSRR